MTTTDLRLPAPARPRHANAPVGIDTPVPVTMTWIGSLHGRLSEFDQRAMLTSLARQVTVLARIADPRWRELNVP